MQGRGVDKGCPVEAWPKVMVQEMVRDIHGPLSIPIVYQTLASLVALRKYVTGAFISF